jgi:hypothetical protein
LTDVRFATSAFAPVVLGFFGLGTGYLIFAVNELFHWPAPPGSDRSIDRSHGVWGIWLPGFCQFVTGVYLFAALTIFGSLREPPLYMAALAFSAYGIHWFALGWNRYQGNDTRSNFMMSVAFMIISALGAVVFYSAHAWPVGVLFTGLFFVYFFEFFAYGPFGPRPSAVNALGTRLLGLVRLLTGLWLMYLTFSTMLNIALGYHLPGG